MSPQKSQDNQLKVAIGVITTIGSMIGAVGGMGIMATTLGDARYAQKPDLAAVKERVIIRETRFPAQGSADSRDSLRRVSTVGK